MKLHILLIVVAAAFFARTVQSTRAALENDGECTTGGFVTAQQSPDGIYLRVELDEPNAAASEQLSGQLLTIEPGFPVQAYASAGSYHAGPQLFVTVGNIDADAQLEILAAGLATGPIYAWNHDGSLVSGWPVSTNGGTGYLSLGNLDSVLSDLEVFATGSVSSANGLMAFNGNGTPLPGWPRSYTNFTGSPAALGLVGANTRAHIFTEEQDWSMHGYSYAGSILTGWPVTGLGGQERHTPAIGDLDGDGEPEIVTATGATSSGVYIYAYNSDGSEVPGWPVNFGANTGYPHTFPVIGDVDGDYSYEVIVVTKILRGTWVTEVKILNRNGAEERAMIAADTVGYGSAPALADLDGDDVPEIIVQTDQAINVWRGDGTSYPGWPVTWSTSTWLGNSSPVVGDLNCDGQPDIAVTCQIAGSSTTGEVRVYNRNGTLQSGFPMSLSIGPGGGPAIADIDNDGVNELIVLGTYWNGVPGNVDTVWAYQLCSLGTGRIEWGQFGGNASHTGFYPMIPPPVPAASAAALLAITAALSVLLARSRRRALRTSKISQH